MLTHKCQNFVQNTEKKTPTDFHSNSLVYGNCRSLRVRWIISTWSSRTIIIVWLSWRIIIVLSTTRDEATWFIPLLLIRWSLIRWLLVRLLLRSHGMTNKSLSWGKTSLVLWSLSKTNIWSKRHY